jgi:TfoX/Sxy family transcriptional regulator of competence genes
MSTSLEQKEYILEQCQNIENVTCRKMMGEYLLYIKDILVGGIYDNRLMIKITPSNQGKGLQEDIPYPTAKKMYRIDEIENREEVKSILNSCYLDLLFSKK